jgi:hypothetical protein
LTPGDARRLGGILAFGAGIALAIHGDEARAPRSTLAAGALLILLLALRPKLWVVRLSGKMALCLTAAALLVARPTSLDATRRLFEGMFKYLPVIALLLCMPLLRIAFLRGKLDVFVIGRLGRVPARHRLRAVLAATVLLTPVISLGVVAVMGAFLRGRSRPELAAPRTVMRGVIATMLWAPTTAAVAVVMHQFPEVSWASALALGVPISVAALGLAALEPGDVTSDAPGAAGTAAPGGDKKAAPGGDEKAAPGGDEKAAPVRALWICGLVLAGVTSSGYLLAGLTLTNAVSISAIALVALWFTTFERLAPGGARAVMHDHLVRTWTQVSPEVSLFLSSGLFATALRQTGWQPTIPLADPSLGWLSIAGIVFGVPLVTALGIHPIVPFSILTAGATQASLGLSSVGLYTMWIVVFMLSMLVSPVSVLNLTTAASFEVPPWRLGLPSHWRYALVIGGLATVLLWAAR